MIFNGTVGTTGAVSTPCNTDQAAFVSFETRTTSGVATITVDIQVSNVPAQRDNYYQGGLGPNAGPPYNRDDSYASLDWVTVSTNYVVTTPTSRMDVVAYVPHRVARVRLTSAGVNVPTTYVFYRAQGW